MVLPERECSWAPELWSAPLCEPELLTVTDPELLSALKQIFTLEDDLAVSHRKRLIAADVRRIILNASLDARSTSTVKSGS